MVFLNPTLLFGLFAASIPIILHFLNLRKIKKVEFSTLAFLKELQKSKIKKIKIKQLLLLLLRILIIVLLVLSFSRPTAQSASIDVFNSKAKTTSVIIIDNSFSMSVVNEKGSYINQSKDIAKDIFSLYNSNDDLFLITTDEGILQQITNVNKIDDIKTSYITTPQNKSLQTAEGILNSSNNLNKELFIFSDFQKSTNFDFSDTRIFLFPFKGDGVSNLSVTDLQIKNQIFEYNKMIDISSKISNYNNQTIDNEINSIYFDEKRVSQKNISVEGNRSENVFFKTTIGSKGLIEIKSSIQDDGILYDNDYFNFILVPDKIRILLCCKSET